VNEDPAGLQLPPSIGGVVDFAYASYAERAPFYLGLALLVFAAGCIVEIALPAVPLGTPKADLKLAVFDLVSLFVDSFVIAAVAIGIGTRLAGERWPNRRIATAAVARWLPVIICTLSVQLVWDLTRGFGGFGALPEPRAIVIVTAPLVWLVCGMLSLAAPIAALSTELPALAVFAGFARAVSFSLRSANLPRLAIVAFVTIVPSLLEQIAYDTMLHRGVQHAVFWASVPIDALTVGPVAALQTVFAIDFGRRAADQRSA
jgi:hypothetical protein